MRTDKQLSIYEVRTTVHYAYESVEIIHARALSHDGKLSDTDIEMLKRVQEELRNIVTSYWTMAIL